MEVASNITKTVHTGREKAGKRLEGTDKTNITSKIKLF